MSFNIWNNLDEIALYLGLKRLDSETNEEFFNRIRLFGRWRYKTDYLTQCHSIPLQTGLKTNQIAKISCTSKYECKIDWEYFILKNDVETIRVYINNEETKLSKVLDAIDASSTFGYSLYDESYRTLNLKFIIRDSNVRMHQDYIFTNASILTNGNIKKGSVKALNTGVLLTEKNSISELSTKGDYFIDYETGYIQIHYQDFPGSFITYKYYDPTFMIESTELNLVPVNLKFKYGLTDECVDVIPSLLSNQVWG